MSGQLLLETTQRRDASLVDTQEEVVSSRVSPERPRSKPVEELSGFSKLLEDPLLAAWAGEAATLYGVTPLDDLGALAEALDRDVKR